MPEPIDIDRTFAMMSLPTPTHDRLLLPSGTLVWAKNRIDLGSTDPNTNRAVGVIRPLGVGAVHSHSTIDIGGRRISVMSVAPPDPEWVLVEWPGFFNWEPDTALDPVPHHLVAEAESRRAEAFAAKIVQWRLAGYLADPRQITAFLSELGWQHVDDTEHVTCWERFRDRVWLPRPGNSTSTDRVVTWAALTHLMGSLEMPMTRLIRAIDATPPSPATTTTSSRTVTAAPDRAEYEAAALRAFEILARRHLTNSPDQWTVREKHAGNIRSWSVVHPDGTTIDNWGSRGQAQHALTHGWKRQMWEHTRAWLLGGEDPQRRTLTDAERAIVARIVAETPAAEPHTATAPTIDLGPAVAGHTDKAPARAPDASTTPRPPLPVDAEASPAPSTAL
ncbi:hypothetical protein ACQP2U_42470 (plasmid) [Nocardia sp. CA-084685]|uniref:hypothetical protein n=1 Tax=Nocardia sp. CA-084685 TaxID=3239970 RepID=UPI003D99823A